MAATFSLRTAVEVTSTKQIYRLVGSAGVEVTAGCLDVA